MSARWDEDTHRPAGVPDTTPPDRADVCETHVAVVFFVGDRAYKLKKPVNLGFLDFRTLPARKAACEREVALNRRFAPDVYLGLAAVDSPGRDGPEPLVVMRRMPHERRLSRLVQEGADVNDALRSVARLLAVRHADARRGPEVDEQATAAALGSRWEASMAQVRELALDDPLADEVAEIELLVRRYLDGCRGLFASRIAQGRIVDGHGDLLADDIFCLDDGPRVLDCLEFDDRLRYVDGLDDAAFLAMDLEQLGATHSAALFLAAYSEFSGDHAPPSLRHHYVAYRAFVRAKISVIQAGQGAPAAMAQARRLTATTLRHLQRAAVKLVLVGGLPGSGKSTLSGALADRLGATLLSSDRLRKEQAGLSADEPAPAGFRQGLYAPERTEQTYRALFERAAALLAAGESVVLDATWLDSGHRDQARQVAERAGADLVPLRCKAPPGLAEQRLAERGVSASDADADIARRLAAEAQPWPDALLIDTTGPPDGTVQRALRIVVPETVEPGPVFRRPYMEAD